MTRIDITENDLGPRRDDGVPAVYAPVGGPAHPNVYGLVADPSSDPGRSGVPLWLTVAIVVALGILFGTGGYLAGRAGHVAESEANDRVTEARTEAALEAKAAIEDAGARILATERRRADRRVERARKSAFGRGRASGLQDGEEPADVQATQDSAADDECLTSLYC